jgi:peroxiredoxin
LIRYRDIFHDRMWKAYARTRGYLGQNRLDKAAASLEEHVKLKGEMEKDAKQYEEMWKVQNDELSARLALARGEVLPALALLSETAERQFTMQKNDNDPPKYAELLYNSLGRAYLEQRSPALAALAFEKSLTQVRNDIFALSGLVEARAALGEREKAEAAMAQLMATASGADKGVKVVERAEATGIRVAAKDSSPRAQRSYREVTLDKFGPAVWEPFPAPALTGPASDGKTLKLEEYRGRNVILVFYLGRECLHCMQQLKDLQAKSADWTRLDAAIVAVSPNRIEETREAAKSAKLDAIRFVSDPDHVSARQFRSYDDFEEMEVHSTILIDRKGRVHWAATGGDPFTDMGFLEKQLGRMNGE